MATILSTNGIQLNYNAGSTPNAGVRIFQLGTSVPGTSTWTKVIGFTNTGGASNFGLHIRWYMGAGRQSGTFAENWWTCHYASYNSVGTSWTETNYAIRWHYEGNGITSERFVAATLTSIECQVFQSDTGAYVESYIEVYCGKWDQITVSY